jgi:glycosyltransferase involved in cell wall biosynthesis
MKITVVMPSYNQGRFLAEAIDSVLNQSYSDFELIIVDACSTDETSEVLEEYSDSRIEKVVEPDNGQADAINKGFRKASGDLLCWMNSDDIFLPGAFARVAELFDENPGVEVYCADKLHIRESGLIFEIQKYAPYDVDSFGNDKMAFCNQACFWKRGLVKKIGYLDENLNIVMDMEYFIRMGVKGFTKFLHVPELWGAQRYHALAKTTEERWKEIWAKEFSAVLSSYNLKQNMAKKLKVKAKRCAYLLKNKDIKYLISNKL